MGFKNHALQLKLFDQFFNDPIFYTPLPKTENPENLTKKSKFWTFSTSCEIFSLGLSPKTNLYFLFNWSM